MAAMAIAACTCFVSWLLLFSAVGGGGSVGAGGAVGGGAAADPGQVTNIIEIRKLQKFMIIPENAACMPRILRSLMHAICNFGRLIL